MKRLITTLAILLVVVVSGMTALVVLVDPNDFRAWMAGQVEQRSGYKLALDGDLRWHVWPQLSILSGKMTLTAPGALQPVVSAENMRLDVNLLPLLSHQLVVKQVMLKGAVVRLTPDSDPQRPADAPVFPQDQRNPDRIDDITRGWKFDIAHLRVADSLVIWQQADGEQWNLRDFNLRLDQDEPRLASMELKTRIARDQRELALQLNSELDISNYPQRLAATISQLNYQLTGVDLPAQGIAGTMAMAASWNNQKQNFSLTNLTLSVNDSQLKGSLSGTLGNRPRLFAELQADTLDLDALTGLSTVADSSASLPASVVKPPVIADAAEHPGVPFSLTGLDSEVDLHSQHLRWRGMDISDLTLKALSEDGVAHLNTFSGQVGRGTFSLPTTLDMTRMPLHLSVSPVLQGIALAPLLKTFELPESLQGELTLNGKFTGDGLSIADFKQRWTGTAAFSLANAEFNGLNFLQIIQRNLERHSDKIGADAQSDSAVVQQVSGQATLNNGRANFASLAGRSPRIHYTGVGEIDLLKRQLDLTFNVSVPEGWHGDAELIARLQQTPLPLRVYGPWSAVNYNLSVDRVLRDELKTRLKDWMERQKNAR